MTFLPTGKAVDLRQYAPDRFAYNQINDLYKICSEQEKILLLSCCYMSLYLGMSSQAKKQMWDSHEQPFSQDASIRKVVARLRELNPLEIYELAKYWSYNLNLKTDPQ